MNNIILQYEDTKDLSRRCSKIKKFALHVRKNFEKKCDKRGVNFETEKN